MSAVARPLLLLLAVAAILRLAAATAGLPLPLASDEEVMIGGALRMLEIRNPFPTLSPILAETLYYPPLVAWTYVAAFVPVVAAQWTAIGFGPTGELALALSFAPEHYWYAARAVSAVFGVATIYVVFRLARELGFGTAAALLAAALLAFDPTHLMMSATARHWSATVFLIWATIWMSLRVLRDGRTADYRAAALLGGLGFGASYIGALGLCVLAGVHLVRAARTRRWSALFNRGAVETVLVAGGLVAVFALAHLPAIERLLGVNAILPMTQPKSPAGFVDRIGFFVQAYLWSNPVLTAVGLAGLAAAVLAMPGRRALAASGIALAAVYLAFLYGFMPAEERYALPVLPILALAIAAWFDRIGNGVSRTVTAALLLVWPAVTSQQLAQLMMAPDTRLLARRWVEATPEARAGVGIHAPGIWFRNTPAAVAAVAAVDPGALRNRDRQIAALGDRPTPVRLPPAVAYVDLDQIGATAWRRAGIGPIAFLRAQGWRYAVLATLRDWRAPDWYPDIAACGTVVAEFASAPDADYDLDMRRTLIFREPSWTWFGRTGFGPSVRVYDLHAATDSAACRARTGQ